MKKVIFIFGTRPEAIKLAPIIRIFKKHPDQLLTKVVVTAQHREMLDQVLNMFRIVPDYDLDLMTPSQSLDQITARIIIDVSLVLKKESPDCIIVQGDTTTTFSSALAAFYCHIPVVHVEAGLRTNKKYSPFPEEINRVLTSRIADLHFPPTFEAQKNLLREKINGTEVQVVGNSVIDALLLVSEKQKEEKIKKELDSYFESEYNLRFKKRVKYILITGHRRESFGKGFKSICTAIKTLAEKFTDMIFIYPVHMNPNVDKPVRSILKNKDNIYLIPPVDYGPFVYLLNKCYLVLTDSGGIQEEAPSLGKPVLVMRDNTERPEGVEAGTALLVGTGIDSIVQSVSNLITSNELYNKMSQAINPYGEGNTSQLIYQRLMEWLHN